jgi:purine-binding chemotaxis protein CheW
MNAVALANQTRWVCFTLDAQRYALPLESVIRIVRAAEITPLPRSPDIVAGAIDVAGHILPVFDLRRHLRLPVRDLLISDQFVIARSTRRELVLIVDEALGLLELSAHSDFDRGAVPPATPQLQGILSLPDGLVLIQDLEAFLSAGEEVELDSALRAAERDRAG